ncbi:MAG: pyridine nucleotide-disulfide oxidoreductase [Hydrogenophilales bacterium 16-64-46]|nr:MAG: pyridine nucleotide-disulfide oxidoreductase [Hydrogenophilales bacterium 12-64-13]OYZ07154.1 MAG: pyridine nucleotide-disulfide oxidoreductase [Hydrogenophilales bacterium 16-64-46]OZA37377.1 MAG: pyridine nucleotide-disulfide oxidoreductase [Hydrogenophilales bacterium 17-64-34]HQT00605.1 FAD-dependent oxidoreductase [Thiobacillus sp.]
MAAHSTSPRTTDPRPHVLVLGGNFAGLGVAQKIREFAGDAVRITVVDRKSRLLYVPNIPLEVFENRNPAENLFMDIVRPLADDGIDFVRAEVNAIDPVAKSVRWTPDERPGSASETCRYDYLVVALGNRLAFDRIEGYAEHGHSVTDTFQGEKLRRYLHEDYRGGPIAIGSARFHQGDGARGLEPYPSGAIPYALAACEGPPVEVMLSMADWLKRHDQGGPEKVTVFTPGELIAEDAGVQVVDQLLGIAGRMGFKYLNKVGDIKRLTAAGVEFLDGRSVEAELKIVFPDWRAHDFLRGLPIADSEGFIVTDLTMRNPDFPNVFAVGDCAAVTVPKLGAIGHQQAEIVGRRIAHDLGRLADPGAPLAPVVYCIGDMGSGRAFYIRSNSWFGGDTQILKMGRVPHLLKMHYKTMFYERHGKVPAWGLDAAELLAEKVFV